MFATGVTIITTREADQVHGMTANAFMSVSLEPPLVLISVDRRTKMCGLLHEGRTYGVSVLCETQTDALRPLRRPGRRGTRAEPRFDVVHDTPLVDGALAHFVANVTRSYWGGDHSLFLGRVEYARYSEGTAAAVPRRPLRAVDAVGARALAWPLSGHHVTAIRSYAHRLRHPRHVPARSRSSCRSPTPHTRELIERSGVAGLSMPTYPWVHPSGLDPARHLRRRGGRVGLDVPRLHARPAARRTCSIRFDVALALANPDEAACFSVLPNPRLAAGLASAYNDWLVEHWLRHEPRLRGSLVVPRPVAGGRGEGDPPPRRRAARFGAVFLPGAARIPYGNPVYDPIWEAAAEVGLPVAVHVHYEGVGTSGPLTGAGMPDFYTEFHTLNGASLQGHLVSILCHGVFERHPGAKVVIRWRAGSSATSACCGGSTRTGARRARRSRGAGGARRSTSGTTCASPRSRSRSPTTRRSCADALAPAAARSGR